jgi:RNA polymerase sigma-70 factor, ECF subfamily
VTALDGVVDIARDRELVRLCQGGDQTAFAELYGRYHRRLHRFCVRRLHGSDDAEEAVQEAFTRAWRALPRFGGERRFYPWLTVIAGNVCTDMLRRRARVVPMDDLPLRPAELADGEVDEQMLRQVDLAMATEALGHLSDRHQRVLRLREGTEWSAQRIAEHEGVAVPAVDTLLWRARQAFKREFAALSDVGGLAGVLGIGAGALRRLLGRTSARLAAATGLPNRPGILAASVALAGAAAAGGGIAAVGSGLTGSKPPVAAAAHTSSASGAPGSQPLDPGRSRALANGRGTRAASPPSTSAASTSGRAGSGSGLADGAAPGISGLAGIGNAVASSVPAVATTLGSTASSTVTTVTTTVGSTVTTVTTTVGSTVTKAKTVLSGL